MGSIRARVTALAVMITAAVLTLAAAAVVVLVERQLTDDLDRALEQRADQIAVLSGAEPDAAVAGFNDEDRFAQVAEADGSVVAATRNVAGRALLGSPPDAGGSTVATESDIPIEDDDYRVLVARYDEGRIVVVGENVDDLRDGVRAVVVTLLIVVPLAIIALAATVWWLTGRTLRPVEAIRREVDDVALDELDRRVPTSGRGDEIDRLAETMNAMLIRLETSSARQRQFVADVSHELRTPVTRMRTLLEVELDRPDADLRAAGQRALDDVSEMQAVLDDLLFLARVDAGRAETPHRPVDLDVVVADVVDDRSGIVDTAQVRPVVVSGDVHQLERLVRNLVINALAHARRAVRVTLAEVGDGAELSVDDDGPGIAIADRDRVFQRFVQLDDARAADGTGLGLAIAADIARLHDGSITVGDSELGGARLVLRLPTLRR